MNKITPLFRGLITGVLMVATSLLLIYTKQPANSGLDYIVYVFYAGGIAWTLIAYSRSAAYTAKFGAIFGQGFRCFIIITLITVIFVGVYAKTHPEMTKDAMELYEADLKKDKDRNETEKKELLKSAKDNFVTGQIYLAIFGTLIMGAIFTAAGAGLLLIRRK
jgi:hypothetical protein